MKGLLLQFYGLEELGQHEQMLLGVDCVDNALSGNKSVYDVINERILEHVEKGNLVWRKGWIDAGAYQNFVTKKPYKGIVNITLIGAAAHNAQYFMTPKQIENKGGNIRLGAKGIPIFFKSRGYFKNEIQEDGNGAEQKVRVWIQTAPFLMYYTIFSQFDIEGIDIPEPEKAKKETRAAIQSCEDLMANMSEKPKIVFEEANRAFYSPSKNLINMPVSSTFTNLQEYYSTLFHETIHWTGHPKRLNRTGGKRFGDKAYAFEELVAELGAAYLCGYTGILFHTVKNTAAYLDSWYKSLASSMKADKTFFYDACILAQKAAEYIKGGKLDGYKMQEEKILSGMKYGNSGRVFPRKDEIRLNATKQRIIDFIKNNELKISKKFVFSHDGVKHEIQYENYETFYLDVEPTFGITAYNNSNDDGENPQRAKVLIFHENSPHLSEIIGRVEYYFDVLVFGEKYGQNLLGKIPEKYSQYLGDIPSGKDSYKIVWIPTDKINIDVKKFQNRDESFSVRSAERIKEEFAWHKLDPLRLWKDKNGKIYVVAGHSRLEAFRKIGVKELPAIMLDMTEEEASNFGKSESNWGNTEEGLGAKLRTFRDDVAKEMPIKNMKLKYQKDYINYINWQHLDPNGIFIQLLSMNDRSSFPHIERNAGWVGNIRKSFPQLTNLHEGEMYDLLYGIGGSKISKEMFIKIISNVVNNRRLDNTPNETALGLDKTAKRGTQTRRDMESAQAELKRIDTEMEGWKTHRAKAITPEEKQAVQSVLLELQQEKSMVDGNISKMIKSQTSLLGIKGKR